MVRCGLAGTRQDWDNLGKFLKFHAKYFLRDTMKVVFQTSTDGGTVTVDFFKAEGVIMSI
jgi:hypothetical protein